LASLRAKLPRTWCPAQEIAWQWLYQSSRRLFLNQKNFISDQAGDAVLKSLVQSSWAKIPKKQPQCPRNQNPKTQTPMTFAGMVSFNAIVLTTPDWTTFEKEINQDMSWVDYCDIFHFMDSLIRSINTPAFQRHCETFGSSLHSKGVSRESLDDFEIVLMSSLRTLLAHEWNVQHETAWSTFWRKAAEYIRCSPHPNPAAQKDESFFRLVVWKRM